MAAADGSPQADQARARLEELRRLTVREMQRLLSRLDTDQGSSKLSGDKAALATVARVRVAIVTELRARGGVVIDTTEQHAAQAAQAVADGVDLGPFNADTARDIGRLVSGQADEVTKTFEDGAAEIGKAMRAAVATAAPIDDLVDEVARVIDTTYLRAQAAVDAAVMASGRLVMLQAGEDMAEEVGTITVYKVVGPTDGKTRPWCAEHVGNAYTRRALDGDDNGEKQPKPVSAYLGGYNCRHSLAPMTLEEAQAEGLEVRQ